jgi:predicted DNA-binding protein
MKKSGILYTRGYNTRLPEEVANVLDKYCEENAITPAVPIRKAIVDYLKKEGLLKKDKKYL